MNALLRRISSSIYFFSTLLLSTVAIAQPQLTQLEYATASEEIIISGSGFGQGPNVVLFDNFEHGDKFANLLGSRSSNWADDILLRTEASGNHAHRAKDPVVAATGSKGMSQITVEFSKHYTEAFISYSVKTPSGSTFAGASSPKTFPKVSSWKFIWLMSGARGLDTGGGFDVCLPTHAGSGSFALGGNDGTLSWIDSGSTWWDWNNYNHMSSYIKFSPSQPATNPVKYFWRVTNTVRLAQKAGETPGSEFRSDDKAFDRISIPGWWGNGDNSKFDGLYDNLYVAVGENALARAVLTDSKEYAQRTVEISLLPKSWSSTRIVLDQDVIPNDSTYYLHIFDSSDRRSSKSFKICPECPKMEI